ncbi:MAG: hypothetical protein J07HX5_01499 [halophilic archaeon J07HX5]|nr:MAG: hypothetical protein J07HX5_01499 [halophilic archaeon J07HX5]
MRIAVPNKGRLHEPTIDLLERAGLHLVDAPIASSTRRRPTRT